MLKQKQQEEDKYFQKKYNLLQEERIKMEKLESEFQTLNSANNDSGLVVSSNYYNYIVLLFVSILLVLLLIRYTNFSQDRNNLINDVFFVICLIVICLLFPQLFIYCNIYIFISSILIIYIIIKLKIIQ
jgi:hypothetical protein